MTITVKSQCPDVCVVDGGGGFVPRPLPEVCPPCSTPSTFAVRPIAPESELCPCPPIPEPGLTVKPPVFDEVEIECHFDLLKKMVTDKFCDVGPKCKP